MANKIERLSSVSGGLALTGSGSTTARLPFGAAASGMVAVTALATATKIIWHAAFTPSGTPVPLYSGGSAVETAIAVDRAYPIPDACLAAPFLVPVLDAGTATVTAAVKG